MHLLPPRSPGSPGKQTSRDVGQLDRLCTIMVIANMCCVLHRPYEVTIGICTGTGAGTGNGQQTTKLVSEGEKSPECDGSRI